MGDRDRHNRPSADEQMIDALTQLAAACHAQALTDAEAQQMVTQIDQAPAGASDVVGILFTIFIILLVTDILGLTKVFPFTRSVR